MLPPYAKRYLTLSLGGTPSVLKALLRGFAADDPIWDLKPDPERFSLREAVAHLAEWEPVACGRISRTREENLPLLPNWDEDQAAIIGNYESLDPWESLERFQQLRETTVQVILSLTDEDWDREGIREGVGNLSIERQVTLMVAHDGYHLRHAAEWAAQKFL